MKMRMAGIKTTGVVLAASIFLAGCSGGDKQTQTLAGDVEQLKQEVAQLKTELANLKSGSVAVTGKAGGQGATQLITVSFSDLDGYQTAKYINDLAALGVFGDLGDKFQPNQTITRAQYVEWLYKAHNAIKESDPIHLAPHLKPQFSDLKPDHPSYKYIQALANAGFSVGYDNGTFKPDQPITREEMMGIKGSVDFGTMPPDFNAMNGTWNFSDGKKVDKRFTGYIAVDGYDSKGGTIKRAFGNIKTFHPQQAVLRHEAAATLWQVSTGKYNVRTAAQVVEEKSKS